MQGQRGDSRISFLSSFNSRVFRQRKLRKRPLQHFQNSQKRVFLLDHLCSEE
jgi:hypothetical protein